MEKSLIGSTVVNEVFGHMFETAAGYHHEYVTPEHFMYALSGHPAFSRLADWCGVRVVDVHKALRGYLESLETVDDKETPSGTSAQLEEMLMKAMSTAMAAESGMLKVAHCLAAVKGLKSSMAANVLKSMTGRRWASFIKEVNRVFGPLEKEPPAPDAKTMVKGMVVDPEALRTLQAGMAQLGMGVHPGMQPGPDDGQPEPSQMLVCMTDLVDKRNPLVGREAELQRTVQVLCRKDKNNPLHVGEPGVGKTALVYGLARMMRDGQVPDRLKGSKIYQLDLGAMMAGTQFRGDFEKRLKGAMDSLLQEEGAIVYIDEIHNLVGAGANQEGGMDASNLLKPYLEDGRLRFIGSTTYEEYQRHFAKSRGLVRRFQQIDIPEPTRAEALDILRQLQGVYEGYHGVRYTDEAVSLAVSGSARHISDRALPDKAIDLLDEAGAWRELHPAEGAETQTVTRDDVAATLARMARIDVSALSDGDGPGLETLGERVGARVFGQEQAVTAVTEAVLMAKAGLSDPSKPLASLLFVGPTGVGKTEVAVALAQEMGVPLVRFDMSEFAEKHAVAKLIGAPAGYVGYDDGGQLTDAVRRSPSCVLLLDEVEKAHPDIYDILLQVMDYGRLTDNKGRHADFRNVVLVMTSNAGARYASQANLGFGSNVTPGNAMLSQVRKTFKPEFINRLSATVVFNAMTPAMASLILDKKLGELRARLAEKNVTLSLSDEARGHLLREGVTREYGARELDRVIGSRLKPLLMREILFGALKGGGDAEVTLADGQMVVKSHGVQAD